MNLVELLVPSIVAVAGSGVLAAAVQGLFSRRRTQAEASSAGAVATKTITDAAAGVVAVLQADNTTLRADLVIVRAEVAAMRIELAATRADIAERLDWEGLATSELRRLGSPLPPPPPFGTATPT